MSSDDGESTQAALARTFGAVHRGVIAILGLLAIQFGLGMWVNLFGTFPTSSDVLATVEDTQDPVLQAHMVTAVLILAWAIVLIALTARKSIPRSDLGLAVTGLLTVLWAYGSGIDFILSGFSNNVDSYSMALGFLATFVVYVVLLARTYRSLALARAGGPSAVVSSTP